MRLEGKVAIVTGGSRGIGRAICRGYAREGARVVVASRSETEASSNAEYFRYAEGTIHGTAESILQEGGQALAVPCDVTDASAIKDLVDITLKQFGQIDVLVSNAGVDCDAPVPDLEVERWDRALAVNLRAPLLLCKFALPAMLDRESGSIYAVTSGAARGYRPDRVGYSASKAGLERMFLNLAEEVRDANIAVNLFSPGRVDTWMNRRGDWPGTAHIPMVDPEEVIPAAVWLAQQSAKTFTGQVVERADFGVTWGETVS